MITKEKLKEIITITLEKAKGAMQKDGHLFPLVLFVYSNGTIIPVPMKMKDEREKQQMAQVIKKVVTTTKAKAVITVTEGWMVYESTKNKTKEQIFKEYAEKPASQRPDRVEVIMVVGKSAAGSYGITTKIIRSDNNQISFNDGEQGYDYESRFTQELFINH